ncbi:MAG: hypothetical protein NTV34_04085 [Proteobacteria bacterium]|nr:hypothetical protein [Pseudomonadota bacterium]
MTLLSKAVNTKKFSAAIFCSMAAAFFSVVARAAKVEQTNVAFNPMTSLMIDISPQLAKESEEASRLKLKRTCQAFAKKLTRGQGPLGVGPFVKATCEFEKGPSASPPIGPLGLAQWTIQFTSSEEEKKTRFELRFLGLKSAVAAIDLDSSAPLHVFLQSKKISDLLALYISEAMPFRSVLNTKRIQKDQTLKIGKAAWGASKHCIEPSKDFLIYTLEWQDTVWRPTVVGHATKSEDSESVYNIELEESAMKSVEKSKTTVLFSHNKSDGTKNKPLLAACIGREVSKINEKWHTIISSARVGMRIGVSALPNSVVKRRVPSFGLFGEFRSGILDGLKIQYDQAGLPGNSDLKAESELGSDEFQFSRVAVGVSFYKLFNGGFLSALDVTPRLGVTNLAIVHTEPVDSEDPGYEFKLSRAATLGIEFGAERRHMLGLWRLWSYFTYSIPGLSLDRKYSTKAARFGLDTFFKLIDFGSVSLDGVAFGLYDYTVVTSNTPANDAATLSEFVLTNAYVGGGLAVSW